MENFTTNDNSKKEVEGIERKEKSSVAYCVTGANGYIGSWLVKVLLQQGFLVHATVRDPDKSMRVLSKLTGINRLRIFKADLQEEGSFDEAINGCDGVFHVAASMEFGIVNYNNSNFDEYVQSNVIDPAIKGTLNVLKSCSRSKSVKRVVFTSSISTLTAKDNAGNWRKVVDETSQTPVDLVSKAKANGWVYVLSKLLSEEAAFKYARENGINLVSVITTTVGGPFLTSGVPSSIQVLLSPITGDSMFFPILQAVNERMGSIGVVHIEDICNAHLFLMEHNEANGHYICCSCSSMLSELIDLLVKGYPYPNLERYSSEKKEALVPPEISSKKLRDLGFNYKHDLRDIIHQTINACIDCSFLDNSKI